MTEKEPYHDNDITEGTQKTSLIVSADADDKITVMGGSGIYSKLLLPCPIRLV
jgi:hypothetical protein